jgi:AraC-like DNA-binding protein
VRGKGGEAVTFEHLHIKEIRTVIHYKPDATEWRAKNRKYHIIGVNISGTTLHDLGYKRMDLSPDCIYFFNQKDDYTAKVIEAGYCYSVHFTTEEPIETESFCKKANSIEELTRMIGRIERTKSRGESETLRLLSEVYALCHTLYRLYTAPYARHDPRISAAKDYMDLHFHESGCLSSAVALSHLTHRRFHDLFKQQIGETPNRYIIGKRITRAEELLALDHLTLSEIAELSGFSDVYYFSKQFKRFTSMTPGQYRKQG